MAKLSPHSVCFTGAGLLDDEVLERGAWKLLAEDMGLQVHSTVYGVTGTLVASRLDTVKARKARELGVEVITYEQFYARYDAYFAAEQAYAAPVAFAPLPSNVALLSDHRRALCL